MSTAMTTPVIVIGAGLAGLSTALQLSPEPVLVLTTSSLGGSAASGWAQGGIAAALGPDDSPARHASDTLAAGAGLCVPDAVRAITAAAPDAVDWLSSLGARFDRTADGHYHLGLEGAHTRHRIVHAGGDGSGAEVLRAVVAAVQRTPSITVMEHTRAVRLVVEADTAGGVQGVCGVEVERAGRRRVLSSDRVVLATGGVGGLFAHTTNPLSARGQGLALAARAGAVLRDLEMVQFHPTVLDVGTDPMPLVSEAVRGEGAVLLNGSGARLVEDDLAARDVVARAVWAELEQGGQVYLDASQSIGASFGHDFPAIAEACQNAGIDASTTPMPVRPAAHYHCGGVLVDLRGRTTVPGLWAVGEVASTGLHGANRLASNSLLEAVVCGRWAAADLAHAHAHARAIPPPIDRTRQAAKYTATGRVRLPEIPPPDAPKRHVPAHPSARPGGTARTDADLSGLRRLMSQATGVVRDGVHLGAAVEKLSTDLETMDDSTLTALLICTAALRRPESLGGHLRTDATTAPRDGAPRHTLLTLRDVLADARLVATAAGGAA